mgnify:CR=1 FL=1
MAQAEAHEVNDQGFIMVARVSDYTMGWEWATSGVAYNPKDGLYYWTRQSGCSCNYFEWPGEEGSTCTWRGRGTKHEALAFIKGHDSTRYDLDRAIQDVLAFRYTE